VHTSERMSRRRERLARAGHRQGSRASRAARGKEWATPGVIAGLQRAVSGLDTGREAASPRVQARLRRIVEDLTLGVERVPRLQKGLGRVAPKEPRAAHGIGVPPGELASRGHHRKWLLLGVVAGLAAGSLALLEVLKGAGEPEIATAEPEAGDRGQGRGSRFRGHQREGAGHVRARRLGRG
jgi:hypothetical protein